MTRSATASRSRQCSATTRQLHAARQRRPGGTERAARGQLHRVPAAWATRATRSRSSASTCAARQRRRGGCLAGGAGALTTRRCLRRPEAARQSLQRWRLRRRARRRSRSTPRELGPGAQRLCVELATRKKVAVAREARTAAFELRGRISSARRPSPCSAIQAAAQARTPA